jgi:hypothetical protein
MKKRFKWLKSWNIDYVFMTCCILHNILIEECNGYLAKEFELPIAGSLSDLVFQCSHSDGLQAPIRGKAVTTCDTHGIHSGRAMAVEWQEHILAISEPSYLVFLSHSRS